MNDRLLSSAYPLLWNNRADDGMDAGPASVLANVEKASRCRFSLLDHRMAACRNSGLIRCSVCELDRD